MSEPLVKKYQGKKPAEDGLAKQYREIGIKALAAAVKSSSQDVGRKKQHEEKRRSATNE